MPPVPPAATSPPLSATPGGVTRDQRLAPAGRTNSCQKLSAEAAEPPMTATAQVPCAVTSEVASGAVRTVMLGRADRSGLRPAAGRQGGPSSPAAGERPAGSRAGQRLAGVLG